MLVLYHDKRGYPIRNPLAVAVSHSEKDERQDKEAEEDHLTQGKHDCEEVENRVLLRGQHVEQPEESSRCGQDQGVAQDKTDSRTPYERGGNASELGAEHGSNDHEENRAYIDVTAHELSQGSIAAGNDDFQEVRSHSDMGCGSDAVHKCRDSNKASADTEKARKRAGADADDDDYPHGYNDPGHMAANDRPQCDALEEKRELADLQLAANGLAFFGEFGDLLVRPVGFDLGIEEKPEHDPNGAGQKRDAREAKVFGKVEQPYSHLNAHHSAADHGQA